jgi:hypothetical protein
MLAKSVDCGILTDKWVEFAAKFAQIEFDFGFTELSGG